MINEELLKVLQFIDTYRERMIADLGEAVAIRSVSGSYKNARDVVKMIKWTEAWLKKLNAKYECFDIGSYEVEGNTIKLPLVILASLGNDSKKKTVCAYCRLDVKDADENDWNTNPWKLKQENRRLYGRGTSKGKVALISWLHCIEGFQKQDVKLPVNVKLIIEGMFEMGSFGMEQFLYTQRLTFIKNIDYICVCESEWINQTLPCISYATVGICVFELKAHTTNPSVFDLKEIVEYLSNNCVDKLGNILIPNINDDVLQITPDGEKTFESIRCDLSLIKPQLPEYMHDWNQRKILTRLWRLPSLLFKEIENITCTCSEEKSDNRKDIRRKFIMKIVPAQTPDRCTKFILEHIKNLFTNKFDSKYQVNCRLSKNLKKIICDLKNGDKTELTVTCENTVATRPWTEDITSKHYQAVRKAIVGIYKEEPNIIRESIDIPIILILKKVIQKSIVLMPLGNNEMDEKFANECVIIRNYFESKKLLAAYLFQIAAIK